MALGFEFGVRAQPLVDCLIILSVLISVYCLDDQLSASNGGGNTVTRIYGLTVPALDHDDSR